MSVKPFRLSVKVAVFDKAGLCLLLRRSDSSQGNPGKWELPGGKVSSGEDFDQALIREVTEETGLTIILDKLICCTEHELPERKIAYLVMGGRLESGEVRLSDEHQDFTWIDPINIPKKDMVAQFKGFAAIIAGDPNLACCLKTAALTPR